MNNEQSYGVSYANTYTGEQQLFEWNLSLSRAEHWRDMLIKFGAKNVKIEKL